MAATELIFGQHAVTEVLERSPESVLALMIAQGAESPRMQNLVETAAGLGIHAERAARGKLDRLAGGARHQGVIARVRLRAARGDADLTRLVAALDEPALLLALDGVTDPRNLGACLRTADAGGAHAVIAPKDRAAGLTAAARKVASGAAESVPFFQVTNLARALRALKDAGLEIVGASADAGHSAYLADFRGPLCLVLGAEEKGLRRLTREHCDRLVALPMCGSIESLNVSVAAGILIYEAQRQRGKWGHS